MSNDIPKLMAMADAVHALRNDKELDSLSEMLVCAMNATIDHPNCPLEEQQLLAALGAIMVYKGYTSSEAQAVAREMAWLGTISPILIGCSETLLSILEPPKDFTPVILTLWRLTRKQKRAAAI